MNNQLETKLRKKLGQKISVPENVELSMKQAYSEIRQGQEKSQSARNVLFGGRVGVAAALAVTLVCAASAGAYGISKTNQDFFQEMFGNETRKSQPAKEVTWHDDVKDKDVTYELPSIEYGEVDLSEAEMLLGDKMMTDPVEKKIGGHKLTVLGFVYDNYSALMYFTLEKKGGVTALEYESSQQDYMKGAYFSQSSNIYFSTGWGDEAWGNDCIFVDCEKSTEDKLYCYDYITFFKEDPDSEGGAGGSQFPSLDITIYPESYEAYWEDHSSEGDDLEKEIITLTTKEPLSMLEMTSKEGGSLEISPISLTLDMGKGLGLEGDRAKDPGEIKKMKITYQDGSSYVMENSKQNTYNLGYSSGNDGKYTAVFNRLVNPEKVESVTVNDISYTCCRQLP